MNPRILGTVRMKDKDNKLIYEASREPLHWSMRQQEIKDKQRESEIDRVTCHCDDCMYWSAGNKCVAKEVTLSRKKDIDLGMVCICETYTATGEGDVDEGEEDEHYEFEAPY